MQSRTHFPISTFLLFFLFMPADETKERLRGDWKDSFYWSAPERSVGFYDIGNSKDKGLCGREWI